MVTQSTKRYCADPQTIAAMKRDGLGWGHDLECGSFYQDAAAPKQKGFARFITSFKRKS
ncbi:hypothetical protein [Loktanella sp. Alg231-35]|uniref:hypothetical protein n=1 Tax=Loktanella sp. Alg231-35 TaxID=1922220 RepID=UPI00131F2295|nr:hypothetical protein [Loktanella sp. Alg231-35]